MNLSTVLAVGVFLFMSIDQVWLIISPIIGKHSGEWVIRWFRIDVLNTSP